MQQSQRKRARVNKTMRSQQKNVKVHCAEPVRGVHETRTALVAVAKHTCPSLT
jgi:hypothetical protein